MNDLTLLQLLSEATKVVLSNHNIWIPILAAWMCGFMYSLWLNKNYHRRRSEKEFSIYAVNIIVSFLLYSWFNYEEDLTIVLQQALLTAAVATLVPAWWFRGRKPKIQTEERRQ